MSGINGKKERRCIVSVIMPVYNAESSVQRSIESFLKQSIREKELICVDDGSADRTMELIKAYQETNDNIHALSQSHAGAGPARNLGLSSATGKYVFFLDADDEFGDPCALETLCSTAEKNGLSAAGGMMIKYDGNIATRNTPIRSYINGKKARFVSYDEMQLDYQYQCFVFENRVLTENNVQFPALLRFQDPPFMARALFYAKRFAILDCDVYEYQYVDKRSSFSEQKCVDLAKGLLMNLTFAKKHGLTDLLFTTTTRINLEYGEILYQSVRSGNREVERLLRQAEEIAVEYDETIYPLEYAAQPDLADDYAQFERLMTERRVTKRLNGVKRALLYGAGRIGEQCYEAIMKNETLQLIAWCDKYKADETIGGCRLIAPEQIADYEYDKIFVAIVDIIIERDVKTALKEEWKVDPQKIVGWNG